jgi:hypothetical protein
MRVHSCVGRPRLLLRLLKSGAGRSDGGQSPGRADGISTRAVANIAMRLTSSQRQRRAADEGVHFARAWRLQDGRYFVTY